MAESNNIPVSRTWMESLSTDELIKLADTHGIDMPPELERIFIIEELLECLNADMEESADDLEVNPSYPETALLPKQYNISFIDVIIRDPLWVFVFWEIKGHDREIYENAPEFNGYCLRLIPLDESGKESKSKENYFTVSISAEDNARYLGLAEHAKQSSNGYVIKLGVILGDSEQHIASSLPFHLPRLSENKIIGELGSNPLIRLSGVLDISITRKTDRQPRIKKHN